MLYDFICLEEWSFLWRRSAVNFTHYITLIFGRECKSHQITEEITLRLFKMTIAKRAWRDMSMFLNPFLTVRSFYFEYWKSCSRPAFFVWKSEIHNWQAIIRKVTKKDFEYHGHALKPEWMNVYLPQLWVSFSQTFTELVKHKKSISSMKANRDPFVSSSGCLVKFESSFAHLHCFGYFVMMCMKKLLLQNI